MKKINNKGFSVIEALIIMVVVGAIVAVGYRIVSSKTKDKDGPRDGGSGQAADLLKDCEGNGPVTLTHAPMDMSDVSSVLPIGTLAGAHVTPIDHLYFYPKDMKNRDAAPVYAMGDGFIVSMQERTQNVDKGTSQQGEYRIEIQHNCDIVSYFDLMTSLEKDIKDKIGSGGGSLHIPVKSGQVLGRVGAQSLDTAVYNYGMTLSGFVNPDSYKAEPWKLHTDDFFKYFKDPIKSEMLAKNPRTAEPRGGKIDYDIDGKLVGNWFEKGTNGYAGAGGSENRVASSDGRGYWSGHFSIAPDAIDPQRINVSFGDYQGKATQFSAKRGSQDPANVSKDSGMVRYELVPYIVPSPSPTGGKPQESQQVMGTVLLQLTDTRALKMEAFPGKSATQVTDFTSAAKTFER